MTNPDPAVQVYDSDGAELLRLSESVAPTPGHPTHCTCGECIHVRTVRAAAQAAEDARTAALLQVCRMATQYTPGPEHVALVDTHGGDDAPELTDLVLAIQHDMAPEHDQVRRLALGLDVLAANWGIWPVDARQVVLAGLVPADRLDDWEHVRRGANADLPASRGRRLEEFAAAVLGR